MHNAEGEQVWERSLDTFGKVKHGDSNSCPFMYQGQYYDSEIELAYNRFRYYDPQDGRYISVDPIDLLSGENNFYSYVDNPNGRIDVFGLSSYKNRKKQDVYAIYDSEADFLAGNKPFYVGISDDANKRFKQHKADGRTEKGNFMVVHEEQIAYDKARGLEQKMIEDNGTLTGERGKPISSGKKGNRGNKINSFDKTRTDDNGQAYIDAYDLL